MRYRRRFFIPMIYHEQQIGHLIWKDGAMEAWTAAGELVGRYPTRREAARALWAATSTHRWEIRRALGVSGPKDYRPQA
jgi:hypothetical protein